MRMDHRVAFDAPVLTSNGAGGTRKDFGAEEDAVERWATVRWLRGGEAVQAARLVGRQPAVLTVHADTSTRGIATGWRCRLHGLTGAIRSIAPSDDRAMLEITVEFGAAP